MSAFMVSKAHVDALVRVAIEGPSDFDSRRNTWHALYLDSRIRLDPGTENELGKRLIAECRASIVARYPQDASERGYWDEPYYYSERDALKLTAVSALKQIACYEYQSCEHDGWDDSAVHRFCHSLTSQLIGCLPGYDATPWGLD